MNTKPKSNWSALLKDVSFVVGLSTIHVVLLIVTVLSSGSWEVAIDTLEGKYKPFGFSANPLRQFFLYFCLMLVTYIILTVLGFEVVRTSKSSLHRFRIGIGFFFVIVGSIASCISLLFASVSHHMFQDVLFGSPSVTPLVLVFLSLVILLLNTYKLFRIYRRL